MDKTEFIYQRWYLRFFCSLIVLPVVILLQNLIAAWMRIQYANIWYILLCIFIALLALREYYQFTQKCKLFVKKGSYWTENGVIYIQKQSKIHEIDNITWLHGTTISVWGNAKSGMLVVQSGKKKLVLISSSEYPIKKFSDCELVSLFDAIVQASPELERVEISEFWYETKKSDS